MRGLAPSEILEMRGLILFAVMGYVVRVVATSDLATIIIDRLTSDVKYIIDKSSARFR